MSAFDLVEFGRDSLSIRKLLFTNMTGKTYYASLFNTP